MARNMNKTLTQGNSQNLQSYFRIDGAGEQGHPVIATDEEKNTNEFREAHQSNGFSGYISDKISLDRAIPDIRHPK